MKAMTSTVWQHAEEHEIHWVKLCVDRFYRETETLSSDSHPYWTQAEELSSYSPLAKSILLVVSQEYALIADSLSRMLSSHGTIVRTVQIDEKADLTFDEHTLQTIERDVWSRKVPYLVILSITKHQIANSLLHDKIAGILLESSPIIKSYAERGDLKRAYYSLAPERQSLHFHGPKHSVLPEPSFSARLANAWRTAFEHLIA